MWLCATIDLSRAYEPDSDEADDSDDEADDSDDDSDDDSYPDSETHAFCEVCDGVCANVTWYIYPHSYHPQGRNLFSVGAVNKQFLPPNPTFFLPVSCRFSHGVG